jgi:uncharacterized protein
MVGKTAVITGGTSGIGLEFAKLFAQNNYNLVIIARNRKKLQQVEEELEEEYNVAVKPIMADLSHHAAPLHIHHVLEKSQIAVNVLVNNAGFGVYGEFWKTDAMKELNMMHVNMVALTHLTKLILPSMVERGDGKILNVASTAAFQPGPLMAVYYASKAYVLSFSQAIANELEGKGVTVTALCPGPTKTGFYSRAELTGLDFVEKNRASAQGVARAGFTGLMQGRDVVIPGFKNTVLSILSRVLPRKIVVKTVRKIMEKE